MLRCIMGLRCRTQVDADPASAKRAALTSELDIARMQGRSNIVSKVGLVVHPG